jgi:hypothetical protein
MTVPLDATRIAALSDAFVAYVDVLLKPVLEPTAWCERLFTLEDPRG